MRIPDGEEISFEAIRKRLPNPRIGELVAARKMAKALEGDMAAIQAITEDIDGKLVQQRDETITITHEVRIDTIRARLESHRRGISPASGVELSGLCRSVPEHSDEAGSDTTVSAE